MKIRNLRKVHQHNMFPMWRIPKWAIGRVRQCKDFPVGTLVIDDIDSYLKQR